MAQYKGPLDYIDVASRIVEFRGKFPDGSLSRVAPDGHLVDVEFREFGGKTWVVYTAFAYRSVDDRLPGVGTAWEPVPGPTQFTRDSEVQNAETAAWGRAMVAALAVDTKQGIASSEEVRNRQADAGSKPKQESPPEGWRGLLATADSMEALQALYDGQAHRWFTDDVKTAFTARRKQLEAS
ncbi:hypothetical protein J2Y69_003572 [Microbacterium resistens]|uniref:Uncharacterized protein n=1 Tax=Microbacterium resistens TaxID=156977 RepID=A0ABU1SH34_9MICO|nr:hypothetical protein [Microbacterium resistens]MDR6868946.1 hypothetical protein [Microbacterium resistens]